MRHQERGEPFALPEREQLVLHGKACQVVQIGKRLVHQQYIWLVHELPGATKRLTAVVPSNATPIAAAQLASSAVGPTSPGSGHCFVNQATINHAIAASRPHHQVRWRG